MIGYQGQVIPAILAAFTLVYLKILPEDHAPGHLHDRGSGSCVLLLSVIAAHFILGPIGWKIGAAVSALVFSGITGTFKVVFAAILALFTPRWSSRDFIMSNAIDLPVDCGLQRNHVVADDRPVQYCPGLCGS